MMKTRIIIMLATVTATALTVTGLYKGSDTGGSLSPDATKGHTGNNSVYLAGCNAYHGETPPAIVYKTVRRNFVTWPCALEVPPPDGALEWERHSLVVK